MARLASASSVVSRIAEGDRGRVSPGHSVDAGVRLFGQADHCRLGPERIARAWATLMERLGYQRYAAQGGDWGALIVDVMGVHAPSGLVGIHTNLAKILDAHGGMNRWNKYQKVKRSHPDAVRVAAAAIRNP